MNKKVWEKEIIDAILLYHEGGGMDESVNKIIKIKAQELSLQKKENRERLKELPTIGGNSAGTRDDEYISLDQAIKSIK